MATQGTIRAALKSRQTPGSHTPAASLTWIRKSILAGMPTTSRSTGTPGTKSSRLCYVTLTTDNPASFAGIFRKIGRTISFS
jgi:hypothetical protein